MGLYEARPVEVNVFTVMLGPARGGPQVLQVWNTWFIRRQAILAGMLRLVVTASEGVPWRGLATKWISDLEAARAEVKALLFDGPEAQKMAKSVREACSVLYDAEAAFLSSLEDVPVVEKLGRLIEQRADMLLMQKQLDEKWTKILDLTDDFLAPQEAIVGQVSAETNKLLNYVSESLHAVSIVANRIHEQSKSVIERFDRWDEVDSEAVISELRQAGAIILMEDASTIRASIREISDLLRTFAATAEAQARNASEGVRIYRGSVVNQGSVLRMFAEERRLAEEYIERHSDLTADLETEIAGLRDLWLSAKLTAAQQKDATEFMGQVADIAARAKVENLRIHNEFCQKYNGMFLQDVSDAISEKLIGVSRFKVVVGDRLDDAPQALKATFQREYVILKEAIDARMETFRELIEGRVPDTLQSRLIKALQIHHQAVHEEVRVAWDDTLEEVTEVTDAFAEFNMEGEFRRDTLEDVID